MDKNKLIQIAGSLWVVIGAFLVFRGILLYSLAVDEQHATQTAVAVSITAGLVIGWFKGKFVLTKTARRNKTRIQALEEPVKLHNIFTTPFYFLIVAMMGVGFLMRHYNTYLGGYIVVAAIYCGIGAALVSSSKIYWSNKDTAPAGESI
ncbi:MAG: hypothetical protein G3M78_15145 [Candidatus Nitrohelix vancouverensis]|uniref:Uncharacterized protein n=1 Tax=Candidatus Nitrohelix vancouverensis TaxID=2705534 RepID=A0A7T0G4M9_9BACT|nr:MAG: hypothetical protein G3M78_15145 [Candidatus Nitrohelix vancouverensis]